MNRIRVCFLIRQLNEGGAQRQLFELVRRLDHDRIQVTVLTFYSGGIFWDAFANLPKIRLECLNKRGRLEIVRFLWRLMRHIRRNKPHILHGYLMGGNLFAACLRPFNPDLRIIWGVRTANVAAQEETGYDMRLGGLERFAARLPNRIIVNSHAGFEYFAGHGFSAAKMSMIPNGIDTESFKPDSQARTKARREWGLSEHELVIGTVGRLTPVKVHPTFLEAAGQFARIYPRCRYVIIGGGSEEYIRQLRAMADKAGISGNMVWAGSRLGMERLYPALDLFVSSSLVEGFPNAIAEAMSCGVPVVATDVGDSARVLGDTGIVVKPRQAEAMVTAWQALVPQLGTPRSTLVRNRIISEFSVEKLIARTEELFHSLVEGDK